VTYRQYLSELALRLDRAGLEMADPHHHAEQVLSGALSVSQSEILKRLSAELTEIDRARSEAVVERRLKAEPLQYILGWTEFWKSRFEVGPGVLIPRPDTETLIELALEVVPHQARIAELGAGSGAIGLSLLLERPSWKWFAWESSPSAYEFCRKNAARLGAPAAFVLAACDFFESAEACGPFDWFISNPPYVPTSEIPTLSAEVRSEPKAALDGGQNGLGIIDRLVKLASGPCVSESGGILLEIGADQGTPVLELLANAGFHGCRIQKDLAGNDRVAYGRKKK
jgi:release factor glutamine methyltransferase